MQLLTPKSELWFQPSEWMEQVQRAAIVCYGRDESKNPAWKTCERLQRDGHLSMFRHATHYYLFERRDASFVLPSRMYHALAGSEFCSITRSRYFLDEVIKARAREIAGQRKDIDGLLGTYFVVLNHQYVLEHDDVAQVLGQHEVSLSEYVLAAKSLSCYPALDAIRFTLCSVTQISTSREMNRVSPNAIAEQSTRYVNFGKRGGITICRPHWYGSASFFVRAMARLCWHSQQWFYNFFLRHGLPPQDARTALGLDTATRVVYTYSIREWRHILDLRLAGKTGKPHPNAVELSQLILFELQRAARVAIGEDYQIYNFND